MPCEVDAHQEKCMAVCLLSPYLVFRMPAFSAERSPAFVFDRPAPPTANASPLSHNTTLSVRACGLHTPRACVSPVGTRPFMFARNNLAHRVSSTVGSCVSTFRSTCHAVPTPLASPSAAASLTASRDVAKVADLRPAHPRSVTLSTQAHTLVHRNSNGLRFIIGLGLVWSTHTPTHTTHKYAATCRLPPRAQFLYSASRNPGLSSPGSTSRVAGRWVAPLRQPLAIRR
eukprot:4337311-Pleurochrysis_carterae.AAC.1